LVGETRRTQVGAPGEAGFSIRARGMGSNRRIGPTASTAIFCYWLNGELRACALKPLVSSGSSSDHLALDPMTTLSPEAFAGHTQMMRQYLRLI